MVCSDTEDNVRLRAEIPEDIYVVNNFLSKENENEDKGTVRIGFFIQEISERLPHARHSGSGGGHTAAGQSVSCSEVGGSGDEASSGNTE